MKKQISLLLLALVIVFYPAATSTAAVNDDKEASNADNPLYDDESDAEPHTTTPEDPVSEAPITAQELLDGEPVTGLTENSQFAPTDDAVAPSAAFEGTLNLENAAMGTSEAFNLGKGDVHGKDTTVFPDVSIDFFTVGTDLVPTTQDVIPNGTLEEGESYWDIIVQPGQVWQNDDNLDEGWNRASFPFAFVNRLEGETHTGIALFLYKDGEVSDVRFQVVSQTRPGEIPDYFNAWGITEASYETGGIDQLKERKSTYRAEVEEQLPTAPLSELEEEVGEDKLAAFQREANEAHVLQTALYHDGVLYQSSCATAAGPFPYCDQTRYGVWSVTKAALMNVSMLRLAEKYGTDFLDDKVSDYVTIPEGLEEWEDATIMDMANMASGRGANLEDPTCYLCDYQRWNLAPSNQEKIDEALDYPLVWEPGTKYVYRDQDAFLLGVTLEKYLQSQEGEDASLDDMLQEEVFQPIGIYHAPANHTIEENDQDGHLKTEFGYYPTLDELTKIALLYQNGGAWDGEQILERDLAESLLPDETPPKMALPKAEDEANEFGTTYYAMNWHVEPYQDSEDDDQQLYLSNMQGFGGNIVTLMPHNMVGLQMANAPSDVLNTTVPQADLANELEPFFEDTALDPDKVFVDADSFQPHYDAIVHWFEEGVMEGFPYKDQAGKRAFKPGNALTRVHAAVWISRAFDLETPGHLESLLKQYEDISSKSPYKEAIAATTDAAIFNGSHGSFLPDDHLTREQMATILVNAYDLEALDAHKEMNLTGVDPAHEENVQIIADLEITDRLDDFQPQEIVTRGQFASFLHRAEAIN